MIIDDTDLPSLVAHLSPERLGKLTALTGSAASAISLHQEILKLGGQIMFLIATTEIALRNTVSENLGGYFTVPNWLQQPPITFVWRQDERRKISAAVASAKRSEYTKLSQSAKARLDLHAFPNGRPASISHLVRVRERQKHIAVSEGKVIAELTFYFWKRLFSADYEQNLWRPTLKRVFPDKSLTRAKLAVQLEHIYQARNRLAHHEPVLNKRFAETIAAVEFVAQRLGSASASADTPLAHLLAADIADTRASEAELQRRLQSFRLT